VLAAESETHGTSQRDGPVRRAKRRSYSPDAKALAASPFGTVAPAGSVKPAMIGRSQTPLGKALSNRVRNRIVHDVFSGVAAFGRWIFDSGAFAKRW